VVGRGPTDIVHDQTIAFGELRLDADYGVTDRFGVALVVPLRLVSTGITYRDAASGEEVALTRPNIHHRDESLFGAGDPWLLARYRRALGRFSLGGHAGLSLPLGQTEADPFARGDAGLPHQHIQFGTGTVNPVLSLHAGAALGRLDLSLYALTMQVVYASSRDYQAGDRYAGGASVATGIGRGFRAALSLDASGETAERWGGVVHDDEGNQGRFDLMAGGALSRSIGGGAELRVGVKVPVVTRVVGGQLDYPALVEVGLRFAVGGGGTRAHADEHADEHDHDHDHDDEHGHDEHGHDEHGHGEHGHGGQPTPGGAGDDIVDLVDDGRVVPLVPVAGKVTVFDFWAEWCKPCHELDRQLRALSAAHPGKLAIRRIDVVDWDTPVAEQMAAAGFGSLPHVKVFGRDGKLALEVGGTVDDIVAQVRAMLATP
jgi:thiol-disulfide isomerase/thioredoxin